jgi:hypothetical protein
MLDSVITQIDGMADLTPTRRRDLKSALNTIARLLGKAPDRVPANVNWLSIRLRRVAPAAHNMSAKRFKNIKSDAIKALALTGCSRERADWLRPPCPTWQALLDRVTDKHDLWKLTQLAQYCSALSVPPNAMNDDHIRGLLETLIAESFQNKPEHKVAEAIKVWNRLRGEVEGWPDIQLSRLPRKKEPWTIPLEQFPQSELRVDRGSFEQRPRSKARALPRLRPKGGDGSIRGPMNVTSSASITIPRARESVFELSTKNETYERALLPYGPVAGVAESKLLEGRALQRGARREIKLTDGAVLTEEILEHDVPTRHRYKWTSGLKPPFSWLVRSGEGTWTFQVRAGTWLRQRRLRQDESPRQRRDRGTPGDIDPSRRTRGRPMARNARRPSLDYRERPPHSLASVHEPRHVVVVLVFPGNVAIAILGDADRASFFAWSLSFMSSDQCPRRSSRFNACVDDELAAAFAKEAKTETVPTRSAIRTTKTADTVHTAAICSDLAAALAEEERLTPRASLSDQVARARGRDVVKGEGDGAFPVLSVENKSSPAVRAVIAGGGVASCSLVHLALPGDASAIDPFNLRGGQGSIVDLELVDETVPEVLGDTACRSERTNLHWYVGVRDRRDDACVVRRTGNFYAVDIDLDFLRRHIERCGHEMPAAFREHRVVGVSAGAAGVDGVVADHEPKLTAIDTP